MCSAAWGTRNEVAFDEVLWARVRRLPEEARRLLEVVAVSGRPLCQADASRAALLGASEQKTLLILRSGRLIRSIGPEERDEIETYHDRVREAVVAHIPPTALEQYHRSLAQVLESSGRADPEVLAVHFQGAREPALAGMHFAVAAAQAAETLAFDRAAKLYRLALEMGPGDDALARRLRVGLADALALRASEPYRIARALVYEASHVSSAGGPSQRRVARLAQAAEKIAQQLDDPYLLGGIFVAHGVAAYTSGHWKRAGEHLDRAAAIHRTQCTGATFEFDSSTTFSLWSLQFRGELAELSRRWPVVLKDALERGDRHMLTNLNTFLMSTLRLAADDPDGAEATLRSIKRGQEP
jgi:hypothetical protein